MTYKHVTIYLTIPSCFGFRTERTPWDHLTTEIKKGGKKEVGLYANVQLTNKRSSLMCHLRSMKREGSIRNLFSNENAKLGLKVSDTSDKKLFA